MKEGDSLRIFHAFYTDYTGLLRNGSFAGPTILTAQGTSRPFC